MTLRVLHFIPSFAGGGAEQQLVRLSAALVRTGVDVHIAHLWGGPVRERALAEGLPLHTLEVTSSYDPRALAQLRALVARLSPQILQTWLLHADVVGGLVARWARLPWMLSERSSSPMYAAGVKYRLRRALGRRADAIVANSEGGAAYWRDAGYRGPLRVVGNIVEAPTSAPAAGGSGAAIVAVGRLSEEKRYPSMLAAVERLAAERPGLRVDILGDGPLRAALQHSVDDNPALRGRVQLRGHVADVGTQLASAQVFVSLSRFEGTPNAVLEAMAAGCPLVLSDIPGHRDVAGHEGAAFVAADDAQAVAAAIARVLDDPQAARERAAHARSRLAMWSSARVAALYQEVYGSMLSQERTSPCES